MSFGAQVPTCSTERSLLLGTDHDHIRKVVMDKDGALAGLYNIWHK
jgi:hypothetical protein